MKKTIYRRRGEASEISDAFIMDHEKMNTVEEQALGEKWDNLDEQDAKNTHREIKLLKKKITYLRERIILYENELAILEGSHEKRTHIDLDEEALDRLAEMKRTVGDDLTRRF